MSCCLAYLFSRDIEVRKQCDFSELKLTLSNNQNNTRTVVLEAGHLEFFKQDAFPVSIQ